MARSKVFSTHIFRKFINENYVGFLFGDGSDELDALEFYVDYIDYLYGFVEDKFGTGNEFAGLFNDDEIIKSHMYSFEEFIDHITHDFSFTLKDGVVRYDVTRGIWIGTTLSDESVNHLVRALEFQ